MAGTKAGGLKARETNYQRHGKDFYKRTGALGGKVGTTGGFYVNHALAQLAGAKGGRRSIRGWKLRGKMYKNNQTTLYYEHRTNQELVLVYNETLGKKWFYRRGVLYAES